MAYTFTDEELEDAQSSLDSSLRRHFDAAQEANRIRQLFMSKQNSLLKGVRIGLALRAAEAEHTDAVFFLMMLFALMDDFADITADLLAGAPSLIVTPVTWMIPVIMFIFLFGKGFWRKKILLTVVLWCASLFIEALPVVSALPMTSITMAWMWWESRTQAQQHREQADEVERKLVQLRRDIQRGRPMVRAGRGISQREAQSRAARGYAPQRPRSTARSLASASIKKTGAAALDAAKLNPETRIPALTLDAALKLKKRKTGDFKKTA